MEQGACEQYASHPKKILAAKRHEEDLRHAEGFRILGGYST